MRPSNSLLKKFLVIKKEDKLCAILSTLILTFVVFFTFYVAPSFAWENKVLILYDDGSGSATYLAHQNILANLMGHFNLPYVKKPMAYYKKGNIENYRSTFYIGNKTGAALPSNFLNDVISATRPIIWVNFNLSKLALPSAYKSKFEYKYGLRYVTTLGSANPYTKVTYAGRTFKRQQKIIGQVKVLNSTKAKVRAYATDGTKSIPYIVQSNNFFYVAEDPMELWYEDQPYIVFAELLHDMVRITHSYNHRALVRIEDVDVEDDPNKLRAIADYLKSQNVPFSVAVVSRFRDPLGSTGPPKDISLDDNVEFVETLKYMVSKGGTLIMHGYTHQYDETENPYNGRSGDDYEFERVFSSDSISGFTEILMKIFDNIAFSINKLFGFGHYTDNCTIYHWVKLFNPNFDLHKTKHICIRAFGRMLWCSTLYWGTDIIEMGTIPGDSEVWAQERIDEAAIIFGKAGLSKPDIWETPHYAASVLDHRTFSKNFTKSYERMPDAYFPYIIYKSVYGRKIIPENLGYIMPEQISSDTIIQRANINLVVRDGFASFFFHPQYDLSNLKTAVEGIKAKGYTFVNVNYL